MNMQRAALLFLICGFLARTALLACAQSVEGPNAAGVTNTSAADDTRGPNNGSPALTGARHPLYRLRKSDIVEIKFTFSPEFDQTATVLPDGFVAKAAIEMSPKAASIAVALRKLFAMMRRLAHRGSQHACSSRPGSRPRGETCLCIHGLRSGNS